MSTLTDKQKADRAKALETVMGNLDRQFGAGTIMKMNADALKNVEAVSTGSLLFNRALGVGGIAKARISEIYGPESSGKTTFIYHLIANIQAEGGVAAFIDAEHAMDPIYAANVGVNIDELLVSQPDYGEQALEIVVKLVESAAVDLVAVDSVAALTPRAELEGAMGDATVGVQARMMGQAMRKLAGAVRKNNVTLVFTNQLREKVGVMFGSPETTPGGKALKFYASQRIDIRRIGAVKNGEEVVGNKTKIKIVKNKVAPPFKTDDGLEIIFGEGFALETELINLGLKEGMVKKSGSFFSYVAADGTETRLAQGQDNARLFLKNDPEGKKIRDELYARVSDALGIGKRDEDFVEPTLEDELAEADAEAAAEIG